MVRDAYPTRLKIQLVKIYVKINFTHSVYGGLPVGETALRVPPSLVAESVV